MTYQGSMMSPEDDPVGPIVELFLEQYRRGQRPALSALVARHPELAAQIRELFPALVALEQLGESAAGIDPVVKQPADSQGSKATDSPPERLGDYRLLRRLRGGGMGVVYEAEHESLKSRVALKVMHPRFRADPKYLKRFHVEARLAAGLHHTNIVTVFDYGAQDGVCYYAMQFIQGQPLDRVLADIRRLQIDDTNAESNQGPEGILTIPAEKASLASSAAVRGLLTGRFAVATEPITVAPSTGEEALAEPAGGPQSAELAVGLPGDVRQSHQSRSGDPARAESGQLDSSTSGSSSFGDTGELRYYREVARIGAQVADALEYAHTRGVLHRDIKPSNLLLDAMGNVWVTDFGLAKLEESADPSQSRELVGTLRYMAPERFRGKSDRRGDIYSLGATLYELLALQPAFEETDHIRLLERIRNDAPLPPRQLDRDIPRDIETIVLKALAKDPAHRFASAGDLAGELRRFIDGRPILSRPVSLAEQFWRWCKRDRWMAAASISAALLTIVLALVSTTAATIYRIQAGALRIERVRSERAATDAQWRAVDAYTAQARAGQFSRRPGQRFESLEAVKQAAKLLGGLPRGSETASRRESLRDLAIAALALPDVQPAGREIPLPPNVIATAFDRAMSRYALRFRDGTISIRRAKDDQEIARFRAHGDFEIAVFDFSPDGRYLATVNQPGKLVTVWDVDRNAACLSNVGPYSAGLARFSPDSRALALIGERSELLSYDLPSQKLSTRWAIPGLSDLAFHPDGSQIAVVINESNVRFCRILDRKTGTAIGTIKSAKPELGMYWSSDGATIAAVDRDLKIDLWDVATGNLRAHLNALPSSGIKLSFHPAGTLFLTQDWSSRLRFWDAAVGRPLFDWRREGGTEFSSDGRIVVRLEHTLAAYSVDPAREYRTFAHAFPEEGDYAMVSVRHDGRILSLGTVEGIVLWDLARGTELAFLPIGNVWNQMFEPSGDLITAGDQGVFRWPVRLDPGRGQSSIGPPLELPLRAGVHGIAQDAHGRVLARSNQNNAMILASGQTIRVGPLNDCRSIAVSPDGQWVATGTHVESYGVRIWHVPDCAKIDLPFDHGTGVTFSPDGKWLMTTAAPCRLWEVGTWREVRQIGDSGCGFSPDGLAVVQTLDAVIRLVEPDTGKTLARLESPEGSTARSVSFSPDGSRLVVSTTDKPAVHVWDLRMIRKHLASIGLDWKAPAFSEIDPASPAAPPLPHVRVDFGQLADHVDDYRSSASALVERYTARINKVPNDAELYHHRAHAQFRIPRLDLAIGDISRAIELRPRDAHYRSLRAWFEVFAGDFDRAIDDLEVALAVKPDQFSVRESLAALCMADIRVILREPRPLRELERAVSLGRRAVELVPEAGACWNALGEGLLRVRRYHEAIATQERSLKTGHWRLDGLAFFILAISQHRVGDCAKARENFDRGVRWLRAERGINLGWKRWIGLYESEAIAVLAGPSGELPQDVFAHGP
jgi:serine/threonine protein kinase/WD40 repeat protein